MARDRGGTDGLAEILRAQLGAPWLAPAHRLDRGTSGVVLFARTPERHTALARAFAAHRAAKCYLAVTAATPPRRTGLIDLPLKPGRKNTFRVAGPRAAIAADARGTWALRNTPHDPNGHASQSAFRVLRTLEGGRALLLLRPRTGRTHQLRVHLAWCGWPICGDDTYGKPDAPGQRTTRLMLHARSITVRLADGVVRVKAGAAEGFGVGIQ